MSAERKHPALLAAALLAAAVLLASPLRLPAQTEGSGSFSFRVDPVVLGVLETDVDTDSAKFEEYRDLESGFLFSELGLFGESADGDRTLGFRGTSLGRSDARYTFDYGVAGRYGLLFDYNKIRHRFGNDGHMLWTRTAAGRFEIADPVQRQIQDAVVANRPLLGFPFLNDLLAPYLATAQEVDLAVQRNRALARFGYGGLSGLSWGLEVKNEDRTGTRPYGGSFGFSNATELPEPIDYKTLDATASGSWNGAGAGLDLGYRHSTFENDVDTLIWDNPFRATDATDPNAYTAPGPGSVNGSSRGFADLAPDNRADTLFVNGRTRLGGSWWANGNLSYTRMEQDDPLLPFTLNTSINAAGGAPFDATDPANLPARSAGTRVDVASLGLNAGTRFARGFGLTLRYRYYDYDDRSRRIEFPGYVRFHAVWEPIARITVPASYTRQDLGAELSWDLAARTNLLLSYNRQSWDRTFREVEQTDEDVLRLAVDDRSFENVVLRAAYEHGDRSIGPYHVEAQEASFVEPEGINNQPGLRKYDEAARTYDAWNASADLFAGEAWTFTLGVAGRDDDFDESELGLLGDEVVTYNAELGYTPAEGLSLYLFGNRSDRRVRQRARQSGGTLSTSPLDDWQGTFDEVNDVWGFGATRKLSRWTTDLSARWSRSDGTADLASPPGGTPDRAVGFDNYEDIELLAVLAKLDYRITGNASAGFWYRYEDYTIDSFILQGLRNYLPGALLLNPDNGDYTANLFALSLRFQF